MSTMGGYSVTHEDDYLGYLHMVEDQFNAYRRKTGEADDWLGLFGLEDGVKAILHACGRTVPEQHQVA